MRPFMHLQPVRPVPKLGNETIASRPTRSISGTIASMRRIACSVCDRITLSKEWSSNPARPVSRSLWITLTPLPMRRQHAGVVDLDAVAGDAAQLAQVATAGCRRRSRGRARATPARSSRRWSRNRRAVDRLIAALTATPCRGNGAHHRVILRRVEQERVVAVRRVDFGVGHVAPVVDQRLDDLARARRREAPVGGERDHQEAAARRRQRARQVAADARAPDRNSRAPW